MEKPCPCPSQKRKVLNKSNFPFLSGLMIALIPKCPYCILAYSSAITMCSGTKVYSGMDTWTTYVAIALAILTFILIIKNYKGIRTLVAAGFVLAGSVLVLANAFLETELWVHFSGTFLLLLGVWVNGSFRYVFRKWIQPKLHSKFYSKTIKILSNDSFTL